MAVKPLQEPLRTQLFQAFSSEYIANILEQRARKLPEPAALILTRRQDLLDIDIPSRIWKFTTRVIKHNGDTQ